MLSIVFPSCVSGCTGATKIICRHHTWQLHNHFKKSCWGSIQKYSTTSLRIQAYWLWLAKRFWTCILPSVQLQMSLRSKVGGQEVHQGWIMTYLTYLFATRHTWIRHCLVSKSLPGYQCLNVSCIMSSILYVFLVVNCVRRPIIVSVRTLHTDSQGRVVALEVASLEFHICLKRAHSFHVL